MFGKCRSFSEAFVVGRQPRKIGPFHVDIEIAVRNVAELDVGQGERVSDKEGMPAQTRLRDNEVCLQ